MSRDGFERLAETALALGRSLADDPAVPDDVADAVRVLGVDSDPATVVAAGDALGAVLGGVALVVALVLAVVGGSPAAAVPVVIAVACIPPIAVRYGLPVVADLRRTRALGAAPDLVGLLVLRTRVEPSLERAVEFAAGAGDGPLARSLAAHARRAERRPGAGLDAFAAEWRDWAPALERACSLLAAATESVEDDREAALDRALDAALEGTRERLADFTAEVRGPATALYAFGVLLPLALVGVLPAARVADVSLPLPALVALYDGLLPAGLLLAGGWVLARRPVAFPPPAVTREHPAVPDGRWHGVGRGVLAGLAAGVAARFVVPWAAPLAGVGVGVGVALVVRYRPYREVRDRVREVESGLPDAMTLIGRRVAAGEAVETALDGAADRVPGATGEVLAEAARVGRTLRCDVHGSLLGPHGALAAVPSRRARHAATLLALAGREGAPAGDVLVAAGAHLDDLRALEREARRGLASVTRTLSNTAAVFGPLVGGVTVAMAGRLGEAGGTNALGGSAYPVAGLGLAVGAYVLVLAAVLVALSTALERGLDRALVGYRVGLALPTATATYLAAVVAGGLLL